MAEDFGIKLSPEETAKAFEGMKVSPSEVRDAMRKHPTNMSGSRQSSEQLKLTAGPADVNVPEKDQAIGGDALAYANPELSETEKLLKGRFDNDIEFLKSAAPFAVGGILGKGIAAVAGKAASSAAGSRIGSVVSDKIANAIAHTTHKTLTANLFEEFGLPLAKVGAEAAGIGARGAAAGLQAAAPAALATAASDSTVAAPVSNIIDRLRASAAGNPRAAELLAKIKAAQAPIGTVTQATGVEP